MTTKQRLGHFQPKLVTVTEKKSNTEKEVLSQKKTFCNRRQKKSTKRREKKKLTDKQNFCDTIQTEKKVSRNYYRVFFASQKNLNMQLLDHVLIRRH